MPDFHKLPIKYRAKWDYGARSGPTKAVVFHMAEGTDVASYLVTERRAGVSVQYTIEQKTSRFGDGEIVRTLPERRISGSLAPDKIRRDNDPDGYYGAKHAKYALGDWWLNPNEAVISVEVAGRADDGPTPRQVESMIALFADIDRRYGRVIPLAHRDFANYKACPGRTPAIKLAFRTMGGHGKDFDQRPERRFMSTRGFIPGQVCDVQPGTGLHDTPGGKRIAVIEGDTPRALLGYAPPWDAHEWALISVTEVGGGNRTAWVRAGKIANVRPGAQPGDSTGNAKAAGWESALVRGVESLQALRTMGPGGAGR